MDCERTGCEQPVVWTPTLMVSPDGEHYARGSFFRLPVCDTHRALLTPEDLVGAIQESGESGWELVTRLFRGLKLKEPKRQFCKITWEEA